MYNALNKIGKINLVDEAYAQLSRLILSGKWSEGEKLPSENQLCQMLSVSRIVVREALQRLRSERLIVTHQGMGSFVANPKNFSDYNDLQLEPALDPTLFRQTMELRSCMEYYAIEHSAVLASDAALDEVRKAALRMEENSDDWKQFTIADYEFHMAIIASIGNPMLVRAAESCRTQILQCLGSMNKLNDSRRWAIGLHKQIAESLCQRKPSHAIQLLKKNGEYNVARMAEFMKEE